ncbi:MAG: hypothetical protein LBH29_01125, partial [Elusimicrobiota bacterium]|nr:hypothetical protein [Elusimicrobiota bacterium]
MQIENNVLNQIVGNDTGTGVKAQTSSVIPELQNQDTRQLKKAGIPVVFAFGKKTAESGEHFITNRDCGALCVCARHNGTVRNVFRRLSSLFNLKIVAFILPLFFLFCSNCFAVDVNSWMYLLLYYTQHPANEIINITADITAMSSAGAGVPTPFIMQSNVPGTQRTLFGQGRYRLFMFIDGGSGTFKDINFQQFDDSADNNGGGAAIRVDYSANLFFFGKISFTNNTGGYNGGAVRITNSQSSVNFINAIVDFNDNRREPITRDGWGAAINITAGKLYFINSTVSIRNTKAYSSAFFPGQNLTTVSFIRTTTLFDGNVGQGNGGAIHVYHRAYLTFENSRITFTKNFNPTNGVSMGGGAIFLGWQDYKYMAFKKSTVTFDHNYSTGSGSGTGGAGAAIYFRGYGDVIFEDSNVTFSYNTAGYAAVFFVNAKPIDNFVGNTKGPSRFTFRRSNLSFINNTSYLDGRSSDLQGGVIFSEYWNSNPSNGGFLDFIDIGIFIARNNRVYYGDAGFFFSNTASKFDFQGNLMQISNNTADIGSGGAIFMRNSYIRLGGTTITFSNNVAGDSGGALAVASISSFVASASSMTFTGNSAFMGGAIFFENSAVGNFDVSGSITFSKNRAGFPGGAIFFNSNSSGTFKSNFEMVFSSNIANGEGGAIDFGYSWAFFPAGSNKQSISFLYNTAGGGGAMYFSNMLTT